jgi:hypothetical protein
MARPAQPEIERVVISAEQIQKRVGELARAPMIIEEKLFMHWGFWKMDLCSWPI